MVLGLYLTSSGYTDTGFNQSPKFVCKIQPLPWHDEVDLLYVRHSTADQAEDGFGLDKGVCGYSKGDITDTRGEERRARAECRYS